MSRDPYAEHEAQTRAKLAELAKTSTLAAEAVALVGALDAAMESALILHSEELIEAQQDIDDQRRLVTAIEEIIQARLTRAYIAGHTNLVQIFEEVARDIAVAKADLT